MIRFVTIKLLAKRQNNVITLVRKKAKLMKLTKFSFNIVFTGSLTFQSTSYPGRYMEPDGSGDVESV